METQSKPLSKITDDAQSAADQTGRKMIVYLDPSQGFFNFTSSAIWKDDHLSSFYHKISTITPDQETPPGMPPQFCKNCKQFTQTEKLVWTQIGAVCSSECYDAYQAQSAAAKLDYYNASYQLPSDHCRACNQQLDFDQIACPVCGLPNGSKNRQIIQNYQNILTTISEYFAGKKGYYLIFQNVARNAAALIQYFLNRNEGIYFVENLTKLNNSETETDAEFLRKSRHEIFDLFDKEFKKRKDKINRQFDAFDVNFKQRRAFVDSAIGEILSKIKQLGIALDPIRTNAANRTGTFAGNQIEVAGTPINVHKGTKDDQNWFVTCDRVSFDPNGTGREIIECAGQEFIKEYFKGSDEFTSLDLQTGGELLFHFFTENIDRYRPKVFFSLDDLRNAARQFAAQYFPLGSTVQTEHEFTFDNLINVLTDFVFTLQKIAEIGSQFPKTNPGDVIEQMRKCDQCNAEFPGKAFIDLKNTFCSEFCRDLFSTMSGKGDHGQLYKDKAK